MKTAGCKELKIGSVVLKNNLILAPMAGVTDLPFRLLCKEQGAGLICMEMVSAKAILYQSKNTEELLTIHEDERPVSLQLFGSDPDIISEMAKKIEERPFAILDINMGCPVPKIVNNGEGSALMKNPKLVERIVDKTSKAISKPVTVKIRKGFENNSINAVEIAKAAEAGGASAIAVHGRTREQLYSGEADWEIIARVKESVQIPVIGNGDVSDGPSAERLLSETGCDGIMIGRAVRGNPWIFREISGYLERGEAVERPDLAKVRETILRHAGLLLAYKGEYIGIREMRKHLAWYTTGYPGSARFRNRINEMQTLEDLTGSVDEIFGLSIERHK